ncbi:MAG: EF-hand domain-containing protein [Sneathiellales bacterium]|nr:EF-hand domain-containing protein [Sneathiellales bacterium]
MTVKSSLITSVAVSVVMITSVQAKTFNAASFLGIDRDANNMISKDEASYYRNTYFSTMDGNSDGSVSFKEYAIANQLIDTASGKPAEMEPPKEFKAVDTNKDNQLSLDEFLAHGTVLFQQLDKNKDSQISKEEYVSPGL